MLFISAIGVLTMVLSTVMIINPGGWARGIVRFSEQPWFHPFEILTRLGCGALFVLFAQQTASPVIIQAIGYLLIAVGIGLLLTPPMKHRQFAVWSASRFEKVFRPAGFGSLAAGAWLFYTALQGSLTI